MSPQDGTTIYLPFHRDELAAQALGGSGPKSARMRPFMPDQHREFFAGLPYLFIATADAAGWPVASVLSGPSGFGVLVVWVFAGSSPSSVGGGSVFEMLV